MKMKLESRANGRDGWNAREVSGLIAAAYEDPDYAVVFLHRIG
jgi:hypothetical protein